MSRKNRHHNHYTPQGAAPNTGARPEAPVEPQDVFDQAINDAQARMEQTQQVPQQATGQPNAPQPTTGEPPATAAEAQPNTPAANAQQVTEAYRPKWVNRFPQYKDEEVGVELVQDRKNNLLTINFRDKPTELSLNELAAAGYEADPERRGSFSKRVNHLRPRDTRDESLTLTFDLANFEREAKGMQVKDGTGIPDRNNFGER